MARMKKNPVLLALGKNGSERSKENFQRFS
jgi:hypothetical protein